MCSRSDFRGHLHRPDPPANPPGTPAPEGQGHLERPRQDSNLRTRLRRAMLYPLSYESFPLLRLVSSRQSGTSVER